MQRKHRQAPADEPAVTFEIEGPPRGPARERLGAAAAAAAAGVGLVSGGASPATPVPSARVPASAGAGQAPSAAEGSGSLDVFDDVPADIGDDIPVTSFADLADPALPPIDFSSPDSPEPNTAGFGSDLPHGAAASVGGGFTFDTPASEIALAAPDPDIEPVGSTVDESFADDDDVDLDELD